MKTRQHRQLRTGQRSRIRTWERDPGRTSTIFESNSRLFEAPNWTRDGELLVNAKGLLWLLPADGSADPSRRNWAAASDF